MLSHLTDSLEKVLGDAAPRPAAAPAGLHASGFLGETLSLQVALKLEEGEGTELVVSLDGDLAPAATVSAVRRVPVSFAAADEVDEHYLVTEPGDYPDLLQPIGSDGVESILVTPGIWEAVWIDVRVDDPALAGDHELSVSLRTAGASAQHTARIQIHPHTLPELAILNTHWLHADSLSTYYDVPVFSERHWELLEACFASARAMDVNSVLTPVWTPPLDTAEGHTRPTVQLVGIREDAPGSYAFDLANLDRWLELCRVAGFRALEMAHLFTQWGARFTPKIVVDTAEGPVERFGWHVEATDPSYRALLEQLIPALRSHLAEHWDGQVMWHISDEPGEEHLEAYQAAKSQVADLLEGAEVVDALSSYEFFSRGLVATPIVATNHAGPFLEAGEKPWVYYCVSQNRDVANRFISQPSVRNRVLGRQLFVLDAPGFLHWGYNFWWSQFSLRAIDPFEDTCSGGNFPGGDPFAIYPGPDGTPWLSIRHRVFAQGMADHRALTWLASLAGADAAKALVDEDGTLAYDRFSYDVDAHLGARRAVDEAILAQLG
ncbi:glycoside hydrolase domain-containing protein [Brachybacterium hainanense]|uniref:Glycoside hydrolase domain-containing protein n=1 Tax=Brachybacterium hainanense TaxID=1541174 RepID=A0ABV6RCP0_9MICO